MSTLTMLAVWNPASAFTANCAPVVASRTATALWSP